MRHLCRSLLACGLFALAGCSVQHIADGEPALSRAVRVPGDRVATFASASDVPAAYQVVEDVWVKDDGETPPAVLERQLRAVAGARGANALILAATNRTPNGTRVDLKPRLDNPFDYYAGTAIWIGDTPRPVHVIRR
ncbi:hypothetical protein GCM10022281_12610 [Sphingomonas rosea]|uniref:Uncharacterized protein n=1 Tax=Sphingomonas rosea TaxID=335605 RepID=A0ABP7U0L6_9SPHN